MDYNIVRQRKNQKSNKRPAGGKLIVISLIAVIAVAITAIAASIVIINRGTILSEEEIVSAAVTADPDNKIVVMGGDEPSQNDNDGIIRSEYIPPNNVPESEIVPMDGQEPSLLEQQEQQISSKGTKESIPDDVWTYMQGRSWSQNPYVGYDDLMYLSIPYYDFEYNIRTGHMIVAADVAEDVLNIFSELFDIKYPIERMEPIDSYFDGLTDTFDTPDRNSMGHNNTSCFCYRVVSGSTNLSNHAYGRAIDLNPKTNPWEMNGSVSPRNAYMYAQRGQTRASTDFSEWSEVEQAAFIGSDTEVYRIFKKYGWEWGGEIWGSQHDYQHFQKSR